MGCPFRTKRSVSPHPPWRTTPSVSFLDESEHVRHYQNLVVRNYNQNRGETRELLSLLDEENGVSPIFNKLAL